MKKQIIFGMASLMAVGMLSTGTVFAADKSSEVPVSYDNRNAVTDPDDPLAEWSVSIPTAVAFAKDATTKTVDVELVPINGAALTDLTDTLSISVKAKSTNGLELLSEGDTAGEGLGYTVAYGQTSLSGKTDTEVATLTKVSPKQAGSAELGTDKPTKIAMYSDKLTYTISKTQD